MLFSTQRFLAEHHFGDTQIHAVSFVSPFETLQDIMKHISFPVLNGLDVSAHSSQVESAIPHFEIEHGSKKIIPRGNDGYIWHRANTIAYKSALFLRTADCAPITFANIDGSSFGIVHIGWKGLVGGIIENTKKEFEKVGQDIKKVSVWIGPMAGEGFEFGKDDFESMILPFIKGNNLSTQIQYLGEKVSFDLRSLVIKSLKAVGFQDISFSPLNTIDPKESLPSWRKGDKERITTIIYN